MKTVVNASSIGAASELTVCADLLRKGFGVFRAVSPACSCDLIVLHGVSAIRVEVRTADANGHCPHHGSYDVLAIVTAGHVRYQPALPVVVHIPKAVKVTIPGVPLTGDSVVFEARRKRLAVRDRQRQRLGLPPIKRD